MKRGGKLNITMRHSGHTLRIEGTVSDYYPAVMYLRNGDPGYPAEGGEIEDCRIWMVRGKRERELQDPDGTLLNDIYDQVLENFYEE